jgi:hypothetical protein
MTKEIVIRRARRGLERAQAHLELQSRELDTLVRRTLVEEGTRLRLDVENKQAEMERQAIEQEKALSEKRTSLMSAELEVMRAEKELRKAKTEGSAAGSAP